MEADRTEHEIAEQRSKMVKEARERLDMTQEQLAEKIGVSYGAISQWETGRKPIPRKRMEQLARVLHMTPQEITDAARNVRLEDRLAWAQAVGTSDLSITAQHIILRLVLDERLCIDRGDGLEFTGSLQRIADSSANLTIGAVQQHWHEVIASAFVTRPTDAEWHLRLKLPE